MSPFGAEQLYLLGVAALPKNFFKILLIDICSNYQRNSTNYSENVLLTRLSTNEF